MMRSAVHDDVLFPVGVAVQRELTARDVLLKRPDGHGALVEPPAAAVSDVDDTSIDFDPGGLGNVDDVGFFTGHFTLRHNPLLGRPEAVLPLRTDNAGLRSGRTIVPYLRDLCRAPGEKCDEPKTSNLDRIASTESGACNPLLAGGAA
jgi:hypothetical protein